MANSSGPYIECVDLFKIYKRADLEVVALRGLDLEVQKGEMLVIVGASGSGKSTLLNILSGLDRPSAGQVRVGERDLLNISQRELLEYRRKEVGFVWQATARNLILYLTAAENVELPMAILGVPGSKRRQRAFELLKMVGLEGKEGRLPNQLSGGEQQRVAICIALANNPPILLADEPTGELDTRSATEVLDTLRSISRSMGVTIVIVSHFPGVASFVDRVVLIRDGRISSESLVDASPYKRPDEKKVEEYLVVDRVGRLQLPREFVEKLNLQGRARIQMHDGQITISPTETRKKDEHE